MFFPILSVVFFLLFMVSFAVYKLLHLIRSYLGTSLVAQMVKRLPTMRETWVQSLGREDVLEYSLLLLPAKSHVWRSVVGYSPWGHKELDMTE